MNHNQQYEDNRLDSDLTWAVLDIDEGDDAYNERTNTIRVKLQGNKKMRVFLAYTGVFVNPDPLRFKCVVLYNSSIQPYTQDSVMHGIAFLIDGRNFGDKQIGAETALVSARLDTPGKEDAQHDITIQGSDNVSISIGENRILLKVGNNELILAENGAVLTGEFNRDKPETRNSIMKSNPLRTFPLPSFCVLPLPVEIPTFRLVQNIGGIVNSLYRAISLV